MDKFGVLGEWYLATLLSKGYGLEASQERASKWVIGKKRKTKVPSGDQHDAERVLKAFLPSVEVDDINSSHLHFVATAALFKRGLRHRSVIDLRDIQVKVILDLQDNNRKLVVNMTGVMRDNISISASETHVVSPKCIIDPKKGGDRTLTAEQLIPPSMLLKIIRTIIFRQSSCVRSHASVMAQFVSLNRVFSSMKNEVLYTAEF